MTETAPALPNPEKILSKELVDKAINIGFDLLRILDETEGFPFHNIEHTRKVLERFKSIIGILQIMKVDVGTDDEIMLGEFCATMHDAIQKYKIQEVVEPKEKNNEQNKFVGFTKKVRVREIGDNEKNSAQKAIAILKKLGVVLDEKQEAKIIENITVTEPFFDPATKMVIQPYLHGNRNPSIIARVIAMADLGTSGMDSEDYIKDSDKLFREENPDIVGVIEWLNYDSSVVLPDDYQEYLKHRMFTWCTAQIDFPLKRRVQLQTELDFLGSDERKEEFLNKVFPKFKESSDKMAEVKTQREGMPFTMLAKAMGFEVENKNTKEKSTSKLGVNYPTLTFRTNPLTDAEYVEYLKKI